MNIDFAAIADAATVDGGGKLNILGIFDRIRVREFPARHRRLALVLRLAAGPEDQGEFAADIRLIDPDGGQVLRLDGTIRVGEAPKGAVNPETRIPHVLNLDGVTFPKAGVYNFEIRLDEELLQVMPLTVEPMPAPSGQSRTTGPEGVPIFFAPDGPAQA